ncbi:uncharacterized protein LOC117167850 isoform X1 [Belonocnema kinseyi]|uniref:uncharacterized protein LOC117167850 isoform X1 n=1 Tax=Belonocnema kinseyi TaxID=2817044 RepID=UPI00143DDF25|nr:uncharacterized protein LOC117167850 isoform X1 [Belonocnema kinseyi]
MKITSAIPIFTFVGFLNFKYVVAFEGDIEVQMWNTYNFTGKLSYTRKPPDWFLTPNEVGNNYRSYQVFVKFGEHKYVSDALNYKNGPTPIDHVTTKHIPMDFSLMIGNSKYVRKSRMTLYNPDNPPDDMTNRIFITVRASVLIFTAPFKLHEYEQPYADTVEPLLKRGMLSDHVKKIREELYRARMNRPQ